MRIEQLNHVGIHVEDVERSRAFYTDVLGLEPIPRPDLGFPGAWLGIGVDQELHLIGKNSEPGSPPRERHYALRIDDFDSWASRLTELGVAFDGPFHRPDGATQLFLRDPDGHVVELFAYSSS